MAVTRLSDVITPEVFADYMTQDTMKGTAFFNAGLIQPDAELSNKLAGGGTTFQAPKWDDLRGTLGGISTDNPADILALNNVGSFQETAVRMTHNEGWGAMQFASQLAGSSAMTRIGDRVKNWWDLYFNDVAANLLLGIVSSNLANNAGDMYHDAGAASFSGTVALDAAQRLGDAKNKLNILSIHSKTESRMQKAGLLTNAFTPEKDIDGREFTGQMYMNKWRVVVDDRMPNGQTATDANPGGGASVNGVALAANEYLSVLSAPDVIGHGESQNEIIPVEVDREALAGNGSGEDRLVTRRVFTFHPRGHRFTSASMAGSTPTLAEIANGANWTRVYPEQKQMGMVAIKTTEA